MIPFEESVRQMTTPQGEFMMPVFSPYDSRIPCPGDDPAEQEEEEDEEENPNPMIAVGAAVQVVFTPAQVSPQIAFVQFKSPLTWGVANRAWIYPPPAPGKSPQSGSWSVDRNASASVPFYGLQEGTLGLEAVPSDFSNNRVAPEAFRLLSYRAKIGSWDAGGPVVPAELIDTPQEFTPVQPCKARFITVAFDLGTNQYLSAIEWGYGIEDGEVFVYGPQLPAPEDLAKIKQGAGQQWNASTQTTMKLPTS